MPTTCLCGHLRRVLDLASPTVNQTMAPPSPEAGPQRRRNVRWAASPSTSGSQLDEEHGPVQDSIDASEARQTPEF
jgi:hypothetical protein